MPPAALKPGVLRSLKGVHLTFTGILTKTRRDAAVAARRAGAIIHSGPSALTTVIVRGRPNALQAAGRDGGLKLMEIKRLREKGHRITVLTEPQFWRLASGVSTASLRLSSDARAALIVSASQFFLSAAASAFSQAASAFSKSAPLMSAGFSLVHHFFEISGLSLAFMAFNLYMEI